MNKKELKEQIVYGETLVIKDRTTQDMVEMVPKSEVLALVDQLDEPKKVVIPQFVAEHIEYLRRLYSPMRDLFSITWIDSNELAQWLYSEPGADDMLARAWLDGYEVEREKLYTVEIPDPESTWKQTTLKKSGPTAVIDKNNFPDWRDRPEYQLTEAEIRKDFEWAWQAGFAKEVE